MIGGDIMLLNVLGSICVCCFLFAIAYVAIEDN